MSEPVLKVERLTKKFRSRGQEFQAVKQVSFCLEQGDCLGLIGESGSGKSTVANMIAGLEKPNDGEIQFHGVSLLQKHAKRDKIQMIFQDSKRSFNPAMTIGKNLEEAVCYFVHMPKEKRQVKMLQLLNQVGLKSEYALRYASELSGGQCQRAAIARALMIDPQLLICDEITSALDVSVQAQVMEMMTRLIQERNMTCLFISHDLALVSTICNRIAVMYQGEIVEIGNTEEIIHNSKHAYTRKLLKSVLLADEETMHRYEKEEKEKRKETRDK